VTVAYVIFYISLAAILYTYCCYPVVVALLAWSRRPETLPSAAVPPPMVSIVISVFNEERILPAKIENLSRVAYPEGFIEVLFGSDGSTDRSCAILSASALPNLRVFDFPARRGKVAVLNDLVASARGEIIVFSDANTLYDDQTIHQLVRHFVNPAVGGVCGELLLNSGGTRAGNEEVSYWEYETLLKRWESQSRTLVGATGGVYAIRRELFKPLPAHKPLVDDFLIPLEIPRRGLRMLYEPAALAYEDTGGSVRAEFNRRVRIGAQNFSGIPEFIDLLHPRYGYLAFALWSHKILRWLVPFFSLLVFGTTAALMFVNPAYQVIFGLEVALLALVLVGYLSEALHIRIGILSIPYYVIAMNVALLVGFFRFLLGRQKTTWNTER
jgi:cellulose synthase/poly-beta-1,6-N-acetylglucosamine synthase-like glycosyltransferase